MAGYKVKFDNIVQPLDVYLRGELGQLLNEIDPSLFPSVEYATDERFVTYNVYDDYGHDILCESTSLKHKCIPENCLSQLENAIETLHSWAENPNVPTDRRALCRDFRLPDPRLYPDAYRLTWSVRPNKRRLHVLWGLQSKGESILPLSNIAKKWKDVEERTDMRMACHKSIWNKFSFKFIIGWSVFVSIVIAVLIKLGAMPIYCPLHKTELVGNGVVNYFSAVEMCSQRCVDCKAHLDEKYCCIKHSCKKCHKMKPIPDNYRGYCDDCFWQYGYER